MDIISIRKDTLGCENQLFMNSAGAALPPRSVMQSMIPYLQAEEMIGGYGLESQRAADYNALYPELAKLLNCEARNVAFAYSATDAYSKVLSAIPFQKGDCILTTNNDYISNQISFLSLQKRVGIEIVRTKSLENGDIDLENVADLVAKYKPVLLAITHIPTNTGLVQQVEEIGKIAKAHNSLYLVDACQSVGQLNVDVQKIGCDFLTATGRKFLRGPRATGFLYVSDRVLATDLAPLFMDRRAAEWLSADEYALSETARRFESQEMSVSVLGLAEAVKYANHIGMENIFHYNQTLLRRLQTNFLAISGVQLLDKGTFLSNIFTFTLPNKDRNEVINALNQQKVVYSLSLKSFAVIDFEAKGVEWAIRFSPHYFNTLAEIDAVSNIIDTI